MNEFMSTTPAPGVGRFLRAVAWMLAVQWSFGVLLAAILDFEAILAALLILLIASPSTIVYAFLTAWRSRRNRLTEVIYIASLLPFSLCFAYAAFFANEGRELAAILLGLYVIPAAMVLAVQLVVFEKNPA